jgi:hypothetical protein
MGTVINCRARGPKGEGNRRLLVILILVPLLLLAARVPLVVVLVLLLEKLWGRPHTGVDGNAMTHIRNIHLR